MKRFKKCLILLLTLLLAFTLTACVLGGGPEEAGYGGPSGFTQDRTAPASPSDDLVLLPPESKSPHTQSPEESGEPEESEIPGESSGPESAAPEITESVEPEPTPEDEPEEELLDEYGSYTSKEDVALYLYQYGHLPDNFITKKEARELGWPGGSLEPYAPGMCRGGDRFGNYAGNLPEAEGRSYKECDIDTLGAKSRGAKRIVFSNDGLIYYTEDHYESFELLYGEE